MGIKFQFNFYHMGNIKNQYPTSNKEELVLLIRREELNVLWAHDTGMVSVNLRNL